jgi:CRP-like cAMP-binding protein
MHRHQAPTRGLHQRVRRGDESDTVPWINRLLLNQFLPSQKVSKAVLGTFQKAVYEEPWWQRAGCELTQRNKDDATMEHLFKRLGWTEPLDEHEKRRLADTIWDVRSFGPREEIVPADKRVEFSSVILEGLACRQKIMASGERQITAFHLSGDFCDLHTYMLKTIPDSVVAITPCRVGLVPHERLDAITSEFRRIAHLLWKSTLIDAAIYRRWLVCLGCQSARSRLAHLFCEFYLRLQLIGASDGFDCPLPATQADLGDAMGMSLVHTNKTCAQLRREGLVTFYNRMFTIHDWDRLREVGQFDPHYLHLEAPVKFA